MAKAPAQPSQATILMQLAAKSFEVRRTTTGEVVGIQKTGARHVVLPIKGGGLTVSSRLTVAFFSAMKKTVSSSAVKDVLQTLEALAQEQSPIVTHRRVARVNGRLVIDMGDVDCNVIVVSGGRWRVTPKAPEDMYFQRTKYTLEMPHPIRKPEKHKNLDLLKNELNVSDEDWDLIQAWLVCAWLEDVPVPALAFLGRDGGGKSYLAKACVRLVDPSPTELQRKPKNEEDWTVTAAGSRVVGLDNISSVPAWLSDALCRAVTGEGGGKRALYTDETAHITMFRRALVFTSVDPGSLRGDLGSRLLPIHFDRISKEERRTEAEMNAALKRLMPVALGALLDLVAKVLANPVTDLEQLPRMADAAQVMAAVDKAAGSHALDAYYSAQELVVETVLESDPITSAVLTFMHDKASWKGTPQTLYDTLKGLHHGTPNWPANAKGLSERITRTANSLEDGADLLVKRGRRTSRGRSIEMKWKRGKKPPPDASGNGARVKA